MMCHILRDRNFGRDKRETISDDGYENEYEEESDSDEETAIISALLDSDEEREDSDIENSDCVNVTNVAVDNKTFLVPSNEQNLFETCTRLGRRAGSWRKSLDEWLD